MQNFVCRRNNPFLCSGTKNWNLSRSISESLFILQKRQKSHQQQAYSRRIPRYDLCLPQYAKKGSVKLCNSASIAHFLCFGNLLFCSLCCRHSEHFRLSRPKAHIPLQTAVTATPVVCFASHSLAVINQADCDNQGAGKKAEEVYYV